MNDTSTSMPNRSFDADALQSRYALRVAARLSEQADGADRDIGERLRFAREHALERARRQRAVVPATALRITNLGGGAAALAGGSGSPSAWWSRLGVLLPALALVAGLALIQNQHSRAQIAAAAEVDSDLLADDLPPTAYSDPGFLEFLKAPAQ